MNKILMELAIVFLGIIVRDSGPILKKAVEKARELQNTDNMSSRERKYALCKMVKDELPTARGYVINLLSEVAVTILKQQELVVKK